MVELYLKKTTVYTDMLNFGKAGLSGEILIQGGMTMATYGYARISTSKQNIERQIRKGRSCTGNYRAVILIVFDSVSRMSQNAEAGFSLYKGINIYTHGEMLPAHAYPGMTHIGSDKDFTPVMTGFVRNTFG